MNDKRSEFFQIRLTPQERDELNIRALAAGLPKAAYVRMLAFGGNVQNLNDRQLARDALAQLGKVGSNLNQIARKLNAGENVPNALIRTSISQARKSVDDLTDAITDGAGR